jgi:AcrR family transcriptional regulator
MARLRAMTAADVLEIAEDLFHRQGYGETSLRQLMAETGLSPTAFYARFESKEKVLEALVVRLFADVFKLISAVFVQSRSIDEAFSGSVRATVTAISKHRAVTRLALTEAPNVPAIRPLVQNAYTAIAGVIRSYVEKVAASYQLEIPDPMATAWALVGVVTMHVTRWAVFDEIDDDQLAVELEKAAQLVLTAVTGDRFAQRTP